MSEAARLDGARCPPWCTREHEAADPNAHEQHATEPSSVPVILLRTDRKHTSSIPQVEGAELLALVCQPADSLEPWLCLEDAEGARLSLCLSLESGRRLVLAIQEQLQRV